MNSEETKTPARPADPHCQARGDDLRGEQAEQDEDHVVPGDRELEHRVAHSVHLRDGEQQQPEQHSSRGGAQPFRAPAPQPVGGVLARVEDADEREPDARCRRPPEAGIQHKLDRRVERERRERQEGMVAERRAADRISGDRAERGRARRNVSGSRGGSTPVRRTLRRSARNVAEMPPAAPITGRRSCDSGRLNSCPVTDPRAEPIWTIGPSRPTDPPEPMHSAEASDFTSGTCGRILPPRRFTAYMTSGTP